MKRTASRSTIHTLATTLLLAACSGASPSNEAAAQQATRSGRPMEVAGIRPGMTIDEATTVLKARGFTVTTVPHRSFENAVANEIAHHNGKPNIDVDYKGVGELKATKPGEEVSILWPAPTPSGGTVVSVSYMADLGARSEESIRSEVIARYGKPTQTKDPQDLRWCAPDDPCNPNRNVHPSLSYEARGRERAWLHLHGGKRIEEAAKKRLSDEVARRVGRTAPSF